MKGTIAGVIFIAVCLTVAVLLLADICSPGAGGAVFAVSLAVLGGTSQGFRRK